MRKDRVISDLIRNFMKPSHIVCTLALVFSHLSQAAVIGFENFSYPDGSINGAAGGTGWNTAGGTSDWGGTPLVVSGGLVTDGPATLPYGSHPVASPAYSSAYREYGGDESASATVEWTKDPAETHNRQKQANNRQSLH